MINHLCGKYNFTVLIYTLSLSGLMIVDEEQKEIKGILGREINKLIQPNHKGL